MRTRYINVDQYGTRRVAAYLPEPADIENLKVGDPAPSCFGDLKEVVEIYAKGVNILGEPFACYYVANGPGSQMSASITAGELVRTVGLTGILNSAECDALENELRAEAGMKPTPSYLEMMELKRKELERRMKEGARV